MPRDESRGFGARLPEPASRVLEGFAMNAPVLARLLEEKRVIVCVGAGGVGKTTFAAALALAAAKAGRQALCLTIDPAQRLATSLGLDALADGVRDLDVEMLRERGVQAKAGLSVMVVDAKRTFDEIVARHASSDEVRDRILRNDVYGYVSEHLAGTQAYMAMEKLLSVEQDPRYETIVLDTPPTAHALDFLDAPDRLVELVDNPALKGLVGALSSSGRMSLDLVARGVRGALHAMGQITGIGLIERVSEFVAALNELFGGFRARAERVRTTLASRRSGYVLVASPAAYALDQVLAFARRLEARELSADALVVNRVEPAFGAELDVALLGRAAAARGLSLDLDLTQRIVRAAEQQELLGARDRTLLQGYLGSAESRPLRRLPRITIPAFSDDVHGITALDRVATLAWQTEAPEVGLR